MADFWAHRSATQEALLDSARRIATEIIGLTVAEAQAMVDEAPRLVIRFAGPGQPVSTEARYDRITAFTRNGVVTRASAG